jgi:hypothetical protein
VSAPTDVEATQRRLYQVFAARRNATPVLDPPEAEPDDPDGGEPARAPLASRPQFHGVLLGLALLLWLWSLSTTNLADMGDYGLLSALHASFYLCLAVLTVGFLLGVRRAASSRLLAGYLALFIAVVHASPVLLYGTLRYAWAWKHVGVVDYFMRTHSVNPHLSFLPVYQNWPGFFGLATSLTEAVGLRSALSFAAWAPPFFEVLNVLALWYLLGALTDDRRVRWTACWLFLIGNWVGQDYFAPQAFVYFLYLVSIGIVLNSLSKRPPAPRVLRKLIPPLRATAAKAAPAAVTSSTVGTIGILAAMFAVVATSHPLTPIVLTAALVGLAVFGVLRVRLLPLLMAAMTVGWILTGARTYYFANTGSIFKGFGSFTSNLSSNLVQLSTVTHSQQVVAQMGRIQVAAIALLAVAGLGRRLLHGNWDAAGAVLLVCPIVILVGGNYDGEALFRVFLFALPFAAFFMSQLLYPSRESGRGWITPVLAIAVSAFVLVGFLFAYYGKESWSYFTRDEVRAAESVFDRAPPHTLIVEGTHDYPNQFRDAERFTYTTLETEPKQSIEGVLHHPVATLSSWLADPRYRQAYLIITRAQKEQIDAIGPLPRGSLSRIEAALLASPKFKVVVHNKDAVVFRVDRSAVTPAASTTTRHPRSRA